MPTCGLALLALLHCAAGLLPSPGTSEAAGAAAGVVAQRRPAHAINVTVLALRPYNISTLNDKDSADAAGDIFFYVGDTLPQQYACRRTQHAMGCGT